MTEIPHFLYDGHSLEEKYRWVNSGRGPSAAIEFGAGLRQLAEEFEVSDAIVGRNLVERRLGATWQGRAATAAGGSLDRAASTVAASAQTGRSGSDSSHLYGDSFSAARKAVHQTRAVGTNWFPGRALDSFGEFVDDAFNGTFGIQSDYRERLAAYRVADQAADDALARHEASTREALAGYRAAAAPGRPNDRAAAGQTLSGSRIGGSPGAARPGAGTTGAGTTGVGMTGAGTTAAGATAAGGSPAGPTARGSGGSTGRGSDRSGAGGAGGAGGSGGWGGSASPVFRTGWGHGFGVGVVVLARAVGCRGGRGWSVGRW
jgi:hypothetical protein